MPDRHAYPDGSGVTITYDGAGHRETLADTTDTYSWTYDKVYRVKAAVLVQTFLKKDPLDIKITGVGDTTIADVFTLLPSWIDSL